MADSLKGKDLKPVKILHITKDDKFFDDVFAAFETDIRLDNIAVLEVKNVDNYQIRIIKKKDKIRLVDKNEMIHLLNDGNYDVVFFYALTPTCYKYFKSIPDNKILIWWSWGYDIYEEDVGLAPIVPTDNYRDITKQLGPHKCNTLKDYIKAFYYCCIGKWYYRKLRDNAIRRVDFFQPVLPIEYQRMKEVKGFRAMEFYYPRLFRYSVDVERKIDPFGNVLMGNSATYSNNHLDVWVDVKSYIPSGRTIIIPLSYGDKRYAKQVQDRIKSDTHQIVFFEKFMPREEYFKHISTCSYAVFGMIRQQAMGNIYVCLKNGVKVFLYKDSLVYKDLKDNGFVVYAIEDIDKFSFITPLSNEEIELQSAAFVKRREYIESKSATAFNQIIKRVNEQN